jgi:uncharacterized membrane protein YcfT
MPGRAVYSGSMKNERVAWIDFSKGICIIAVVTMYATGKVKIPGQFNWVQYWTTFARPFRMPDFFLISGLFLGRVIDRPWRGYLDKKVLHYLYFFAVWTLIDFPFLVLVGKSGRTPRDAAFYFLKMIYEPYAMLWFIQMLAIYFTMARLLRRFPVWLVLALALAWQAADLRTPYYQVNAAGERFIYFFAGYAYAPRFFELAEWARRRSGAALAALAAWAVFNGVLVAEGFSTLPCVVALLGFLGAGAVIVVSSLLSGARSMGWLRKLGERSIVVYLSFLHPLTFFLWLGFHQRWVTDGGTLTLAATALSVAACAALDRATRGTVLAFLYERPEWAKLSLEPRSAGLAVVGDRGQNDRSGVLDRRGVPGLELVEAVHDRGHAERDGLLVRADDGERALALVDVADAP